MDTIAKTPAPQQFHPDLTQELIANIRERMDADGMKLNTLSTVTGIPLSTLSRKLNGRVGLSIMDLARISEALHCHLQDLLHKMNPAFPLHKFTAQVWFEQEWSSTEDCSGKYLKVDLIAANQDVMITLEADEDDPVPSINICVDDRLGTTTARDLAEALLHVAVVVNEIASRTA